VHRKRRHRSTEAPAHRQVPKNVAGFASLFDATLTWKDIEWLGPADKAAGAGERYPPFRRRAAGGPPRRVWRCCVRSSIWPGAVGLPQSHRHHQRSCSSLVGLGYPPDELRGSCFFRGIKALFHHLCHVQPPIQSLQILHPVRAEIQAAMFCTQAPLSTAHGSAHISSTLSKLKIN
jgi:hypothetical protein